MARKFSKSETASTSSQPEKPSAEEIAQRAYSYYLQEGQVDGHANEHWLRAEQELRTERNNLRTTAPAPASRNRKQPANPQHN